MAFNFVKERHSNTNPNVGFVYTVNHYANPVPFEATPDAETPDAVPVATDSTVTDYIDLT